MRGAEADVIARQRDSAAKHGARFVDDVTDVKIDGDRATGHRDLPLREGAGQQDDTPMTFVREDGAWKVCSTGPGYACGTLATVSYAGDITPEEAWKLLNDNPEAVLVDCRTDAEWRFVGVADLSSLGRDVVYIEWNRTDGSRNESFVDDLIEAGVAPGDRPVVFLCRSGNRSIGAAEAATAAGIAPSYNVLDGFEGNLDEQQAPRRHGLAGRRPALEAVMSDRDGAVGAHSAPNCRTASARPPSVCAAGCCGRASRRPPRRCT